ncbi:MAG TPA: G1 family glutamic endopeptidase [Terriglobia bacterium]|nr:G1 family glutamic endopeptidase [Terriglobia bacterium]HTW80614.1 G1 family glutamic endopeptidase [Terracidiphilus sp.]
MNQTKIGSGIKITTFEKPPADFDLHSAKPRDLLRYGLPSVPRNASEKKRHQDFVRALVGKFEYIEPEFKIRAPKSDRRLKKKAVVSEGIDNTGNWCGCQLPASVVDEMDGFQYVTGEFTVPNVSAPAAPFQYLSSHWIGLGQTNILQAGVECDAILKGNKQHLDFYTWWEFANVAELVEITNFHSSPGDMLQLLICSDNGNGSQGGTIYLTNRISGLSTSFGVEYPGATLDANFAEWISEIPTENRVAYVPVLSDFGQVYYSSCVAGLAGGETALTSSDGNVVNMLLDVNDPTSVRCQGYQLGEQVVRAQYLGPIP